MKNKDKRHPVRLIHRRLAAENTMYQVFFDHIIGDGGLPIPSYLVVMPKGRRHDGIAGVAILPIFQDRVLLVRTYRHAIGEYTWEVPRGFVAPREDIASAALRELREETGLTCNPENLVSLGFIFPESGTLATKNALFAAKDCRRVGQRLEDEIGLGPESLFTISQISEMATNFLIEDVSTLALIYRFLQSPRQPGNVCI